MIKRRFYRLEHGEEDAPSKSSSSDSEVEAEATDESEFEEEKEEEEEDENENADGEEGNEEEPSSHGYESENSSLNEDHPDLSGLLQSNDDVASQNGKLNMLGNSSREDSNSALISKQQDPEKDEIKFESENYVLKSKSVLKCRICPRVVCLSMETLKDHLNSKKHARSEKLLREGRLKFMLNDKGKIEGEETYQQQKHDTSTIHRQKSKPTQRRKERFNQKKRIRQNEKARGTRKRQKSDD